MEKSKFLVRFDDLACDCNWDFWDDILDFLISNNVKPLLAVIPNNKNEGCSYIKSIPEELFWEKVRYYQNKGCFIALHGETHEKINNKKGIMRVTKSSEFVGLSYDEQYKKISNGYNILMQNNIKVDGWIAPFHSFDRTTLKVLKELNINIISDSYSKYPYSYKGFKWIPCQLWDRFRKKSYGIYTICYHPSAWDYSQLEFTKSDILKNIDKIVSVSEIIDIDKNTFVSLAQHYFLVFKYQIKSILFSLYCKFKTNKV